MDNVSKYDQVFKESFSIEQTELGEKLEYNGIDSWDSIGHMTLVAGFEDAFNISMETEDIVNLSSYNKGKEILAKYGVTF